LVALAIESKSRFSKSRVRIAQLSQAVVRNHQPDEKQATQKNSRPKIDLRNPSSCSLFVRSSLFCRFKRQIAKHTLKPKPCQGYSSTLF
jgi:hypothetical protein